MRSRPLGTVGRAVSEIGLGCWQLGGGDWPAIDDATALRVLRTAHEHGVTLFDTADIYGGGRSERLVGQLCREVRPASPFVATKIGRRPDPGWPDNFRPEAMRAHVEESLARLGVDALDLLQLHCVPLEELRRGDVFATLRTFVEEGKVRAFGASVESMAEAETCLSVPDLAALQIIFNVLRQEPIDKLFARASERGVALIVRLPLASGLLSGRFTARTTFTDDDHRSFNRDGRAFNVGETFAGIPFEVGLELVEELRAMLPAETSMAQSAQRWILDHDAVTTVITGASRPEQVVENAAVSGLPPLPESLHARLRAFYRTRVHAKIRGPY